MTPPRPVSPSHRPWPAARLLRPVLVGFLAACGGGGSDAPTAPSGPGAPTSLAAVGGDAAATLSFGPPASAGSSAITAYEARCAGGGTTSGASGVQGPITLTGLVNDVPYTCTVAARNAAGLGPTAGPVSVTPAAPRTVPGTPTLASATPGDGNATLLFTAPAATGGSPITGYTAVCTPTAGTVRSQAGAASPITVAGLTNGVSYGCAVSATNAVGTGIASAPLAVTPAAAATAPSAPQNVTATAGVAAITLGFSAPASTGGSAITGYTAACTTAGTTVTASGAASPITVEGLTPGATYTCAATARNAVGSSPASASVTATPAAAATVPGAPTNVAASAGYASATVSFTAPSSNGGAAITGYTVACTGGGATVTANGAASPITVGGLTNGVAYGCTVAATNSAGTGPASSAASVTPTSGTSTTAGVLCGTGFSAGSGTSSFTGSAGPSGSYAYSLAYSFSWSCGTARTLTGNGVPSHASTGGAFATAASAQSVSRTFTLTPAIVAPNGTYLAQGVMAYALNSVKFDPATDGGCSSTATGTGQGQGCVAAGAMQNPSTYPWNLEALSGVFQFGTDAANAHTQPDGAYHYHGLPTTYLTQLGASSSRMTLVGWALDGFPIYAHYGYGTATDATSAIRKVTPSWQLKATPDASRPSTSIFPLGTFTQDYQYVAGSGDLDQCNGRFGVTPEFPQGIYHYYITDTFPFVQRCWKGR